MNKRILQQNFSCFLLAALYAWGCGPAPFGPASPESAAGVREQKSVRPNIVLIVADELPADVLDTRFFSEAVVRFQGVQPLSSATGSEPWSSMAIRSSLLTGLHPDTLGLRNPAEALSAVVPLEVRTFPEILRRSGYFTVRSGAARHGLSVSATGSVSDRQLELRGLLGAWNVSGIGVDWRRGPSEPCAVSFGCWDYEDDGVVPFFAMFNLDGPPHLIKRDITRVMVALEADEVADKTVVIAIGTTDVQPLAIWNGYLDSVAISNVSVSVLDVAPTVLSLADAPTPPYMLGRVFMGSPAASSIPGRPVLESTDSIESQVLEWENGIPPVASTPTGYPTGGVFHVAPMVELSCETESSTIIYSTERAAPFYWRLYTRPFRMRFWTLRFQCGRLGFQDSEVVSYDFTIE